MKNTGDIARYVRFAEALEAKQRQSITTGAFYLKLILGVLFMSALVFALMQGCEARPAQAAEIQKDRKHLYGTASWYSVDSAIREGTCTDASHRRCLQANGRALNDTAYTAASWDYQMGTRLTVCLDEKCPRQSTHRMGIHCVPVVVRDRGPAKSLYRQGRILDLSRAAFAALAPLKTGIINITVEAI